MKTSTIKRSILFSLTVAFALISVNSFSVGQEVTAEWPKKKSGTESLLARFQVHDSSNKSLNEQFESYDAEFSADSNLLMMLYQSKKTNDPGRVHVWDLQLNRELLQTEFKFGRPKFLANKFLICGSHHGVEIWSLESGKSVGCLDHQSVDRIIATDDGKTLLTFSDHSKPYQAAEYRVKLWNADDWTNIVSEFNDDMLFGPVLADNGKVLVGCKHQPRRLIAWKTDTGEEIWSQKSDNFQSSWHLDTSQERLIVTSYSGVKDSQLDYRQAEVIDIQTGKSGAQVLPPEGARWVGFVMQPPEVGDDKLFARGGSDYDRFFWGRPPFIPIFRRDNRLLVWHPTERDMRVELNMEQIFEQEKDLENDHFHAIPLTDTIYGFTASSNVLSQHYLVMVDLTTGYKVDWNFSPIKFCITTSGEQLAQIQASSPDRVIVSSLPSGEEVCSLSHADVDSVAYAPKGEKIATISKSEIKIWDLTTFQEKEHK